MGKRRFWHCGAVVTDGGEAPGSGPLAGVTVLELGGIGPLPLLAMLFADLGARIVRIDPVGPSYGSIGPHLWIFRGQESLTLDLRRQEGRDALFRLVERADILVEGYRAGVTERLGVGPEACLARNPRLIYGRMTGWGSSGPLAEKGGHDLNYISITGALDAMGQPGTPPPVPLNLVGDFGGGAMMLAMGVLAALHEREQSGRGQVVEAAMSNGALALMALFYAMRDAGHWIDERGATSPREARPSTAATRRVTAGTWRSARSRTSSTPISSTDWVSIPPSSPPRTTSCSGRR